MQYLHYIEESKSWTCPKSGVWKVICVGGGASGGALGIQRIGATTSFGNFASAAGGQMCELATTTRGISGFDGINYASSEYNTRCYGSGGGSTLGYFGYETTDGHSVTLQRTCTGGFSGKIKSSIINIDEGQQVVCTIGKGGDGTFTTQDIIKELKISNFKKWNDNTTDAVFRAENGADGVIIVQYLGESI